jgi:hypothetical protein
VSLKLKESENLANPAQPIIMIYLESVIIFLKFFLDVIKTRMKNQIQSLLDKVAIIN